MPERRISAREFLREFAQSQTRVQLGFVAFAATFSLIFAVTEVTAGLSRWLAVAAAAGTLVFEGGLAWWLLGLGRVQRWIRDGSGR